MLTQDVFSTKLGFRAEELFMQFFQNLQYAEVLETTVARPTKPVAIVKTPQEIDELQGIDFFVYHRLVGWVGVDISIDSDPYRLARKREKERAYHVFLIVLDIRVLSRAARGCHRDISVISERLKEMFLEAKEDPAYVIQGLPI